VFFKRYIEGTPDLVQSRGRIWKFCLKERAPSEMESRAAVADLESFFQGTSAIDPTAGDLVYAHGKERTLILSLSSRRTDSLVELYPALSQWLARDRASWRIVLPKLGESFAFVIYPTRIRWPMEDRWTFEESVAQARLLSAEDNWLVRASHENPYDFE